MLTLHIVDGGSRGLQDATLSIGLLNPEPASGLQLYDFGTDQLRAVYAEQIVAVAETSPARVSFAPELQVQHVAMSMAANRSKVARLPLRRKRVEVPTGFVSGYDEYARSSAIFWRKHGVGSQPALAAGVFSLSSIQTNIVTALRLFSMLTPFVLLNELPDVNELQAIVKKSGAGLESKKTGRPAWFAGYERYRYDIVEAINDGLRDDALRRVLATLVDVPLGLGLAKLSFILALLGNNSGCLDARILSHAYTAVMRKRFNEVTKKKGGRYTERAYDTYRSSELQILQDSPFFDPDDPVGLARAQWMLWESLGPESDRRHTHEELFRAVLEPAWLL